MTSPVRGQDHGSDDAVDTHLRPQRLEEFIGQSKAKQNLRIFIEAARARGEATVPTTIALERATNPFMRATSEDELAARRTAKDMFRG